MGPFSKNSKFDLTRKLCFTRPLHLVGTRYHVRKYKCTDECDLSYLYSRYNASLWETKTPFGFRSNLFMHGFVILSESRFIITETSLLEKPMSLITQSLNFNTSTHINSILILFLFVININSE